MKLLCCMINTYFLAVHHVFYDITITMYVLFDVSYFHARNLMTIILEAP